MTIAHVDGGSRGNPGPAGYGVRLTRDDGSIVDLKASIGTATNNIAEYNGLLARRLVDRIGRVKFEHVRREVNQDADRLANEAMDEAAASSPLP